jgi:hypothetical protein
VHESTVSGVPFGRLAARRGWQREKGSQRVALRAHWLLQRTDEALPSLAVALIPVSLGVYGVGRLSSEP